MSGRLDTIYALASGAGRAAVAVIRLSGARTHEMLCGLCTVPAPRRASLRTLRAGGAVLDQALVLWMPGPASYTGEDSAELHVHGGRAVIQAVSAALLDAGARPADPGEFTRRAFLSGRLGLLQAEAIAALSEAETEAQRLQAQRQLGGQADDVLEDWTARLTRCLAWQEAIIDFPDDTAPDQVDAELAAEIGTLLREIAEQLTAGQAGVRVRQGLVFVISGAPNVGKSSLFNRLTGRDMAIVSPLPGTTRDVLEARLDLGGVAVTLVDTAGLRVAADAIEAEGVRRAEAQLARADLVVHVIDAHDAPPEPRTGQLIVCSKSDLVSPPAGVLGVSAVAHAGVESLLHALTEQAHRLVSSEHEPLLSSARQLSALRDTHAALAAALETDQADLRAEELRQARFSLGRLSGQVDTEQILDVVFRAFCIGK